MEEEYMLELHKYGYVKTDERVNFDKIVKYANKMRKEKETGPCDLTIKNIGPKPEKRLGIDSIQEYLDQMDDFTSKEFKQRLLDDGVHTLDMEWLIEKKELEYKAKPFPSWMRKWFGKTRKRTMRSKSPWFRKKRRPKSLRRSKSVDNEENEKEKEYEKEDEKEDKKEKEDKNEKEKEDEKEDEEEEKNKRKTRGLKRKLKNKQTKKEKPQPPRRTPRPSPPVQPPPRQTPPRQTPPRQTPPRQTPPRPYPPRQTPPRPSPPGPSPVSDITTFFPSPKGKDSLARELKKELTEKIKKSKKVVQFDELRNEYNSAIREKINPVKLKQLRSQIDRTVGEIEHSPEVSRYTAAIDARNKTIAAKEALSKLKSTYPSPSASQSQSVAPSTGPTPSVAPSAGPSTVESTKLSPASRVRKGS